MTRNRYLLYGLLGLLLAALFWLQFRTWRGFAWERFWQETGHAVRGSGLFHVIAGIAFTYLAYILRALRWRIFLRPVKNARTVELIAPTIIGFTGIALLGRLGELIRPYLIARKQGLPFPSQLAVWAVERIFDFGGFALLLISAIFFAPGLKRLDYYGRFREGGLLLIAFVMGLAVVAIVINLKGEPVAAWVEHQFRGHSSGIGHKIAARVREFHRGLDTIHGFNELLQLIAISMGMWYVIVLAYQQVVASYGLELLRIPVPQLCLVVFSSMLGSIVQLPGVGGGSQLATISTLHHVFHVPPEVATSCGILLWMVTFMSVVPLGLILSNRERLSLRKLSEVSHEEEVTSETL